jgi:hypothetical protein
MYADINLVIKKENNTPKKKQVDLLKRVSFGILFIVAFLSVIFFLLNLRFSVTSIKKQQKAVIQNLSTYDQTAIKIFLLNSRLSDISRILNSRVKYNESVGKIIFSVTPSMTVEDFSVNKKKLSITIISPSLLDLNDFLNKTLSYSATREVSSVSLKELQVSDLGYIMKLEMDLP